MASALELDVDAKWLSRQLRESGRTQAELARYLNLEPPQVSKTLKGKRRIQGGEVDLIRQFFRASPTTDLPQPETRRPRAPFIDENMTAPLRSEMARDVPIYGTVTADGRLVAMKKAIDYARRPPRLNGRNDVFVVWVDDYRMAPAFRPGTTILVEAARPPAPGDDVIVQVRSETPGGEDETVLKHLLSIDGNSVRLEHYNPPATIDLPRERIAHLFRVMTLTDLLIS